MCKLMKNPVAFSVNLIYLCHPNTLGIIYKVCRHGDRRAQTSELRSCDWCWARQWTPAYCFLICRKWTIVLRRSICIFQINKRILAGATAGLCLWCVPDDNKSWILMIFFFFLQQFIFIFKAFRFIAQFSERLLLFLKLIGHMILTLILIIIS